MDLMSSPHRWESPGGNWRFGGEQNGGLYSPWSPLWSVGLLLLKAIGLSGALFVQLSSQVLVTAAAPCLFSSEGCLGSPLLLASGYCDISCWLFEMCSLFIHSTLFKVPHSKGPSLPARPLTAMKLFSSSAPIFSLKME